MVSFAIILIFSIHFSSGNVDEVLNYYETLHHDSLRHHIRRRDLYTKDPIERSVEFRTHGKQFRLMLHTDTSVLSSDFKLLVASEDGSRAAEIDPVVYRGYVADEPGTSSVSAYWNNDDEFIARIVTESDVYVVEPSWRHLPESSDYTLISYRESDMKEKEKSEPESCGVREKFNHGGNGEETRMRRDSGSYNPWLPKKTCQVLVVADYRFYSIIGRQDVTTTAKYLIVVMDMVNGLFREESFAECGKGFGLEIKTMRILHKPHSGIHYNNNSLKWEFSENLLSNFSSQDTSLYSEHCLVHLFTAVPLHSGVFGIAYVGNGRESPTSGICPNPSQRHGEFHNTGFSTFIDRNSRRLLSLQARLVVAHEIGHGWGSNHDPSTTNNCSPSEEGGGKYLMYPIAVTGLLDNNEHFSSCSKEYICNALKFKSQKCFMDKMQAFCGNYELEESEECDEGPAGNSARCCDMKCRLMPGASCSFSNKTTVCCDNCKIANSSKICHDEADQVCTETTYCSGDSFFCRDPAPKPNGTECMKSGRCFNKKCVSLCEYNNREQCQCDSVELSCKVCCRNPLNSNDSCEPFLENGTVVLKNVADNTICSKGICINGTCQPITDTSLVRLWAFIDFRSVELFVVYMKNNIVGTVIVLSLLFWIPASCFVSYIDRKRAQQDIGSINWLSITNSMLIPQDDRSARSILVTKGTIERRQMPKRERLRMS